MFLVLVVAGLAVGGYFHWWAHRDRRGDEAAREVVVEIQKGDSLRRVATRLAAAHVAEPSEFMVALGLLKRADQRLQAGRYRFELGAPPVRILDRLVRGPNIRGVKCTLPEGWTANQIADRLVMTGVIPDAEPFLRLCRDPEFVKSLGLPGDELEGYLFPDTYEFAADATPEQVIRRMVARFDDAIDSLGLRPGINSRNAYPLTFEESVTLASIIEREARGAEEMPMIASVYHNRLKKGMRLQSCATVRYALENWDKRLTQSDLDFESPYNTYVNDGLPPAPICNPGLDALEAAFRPAESDYLYYVYKGDGRHQFSRTLREHNQARRKYRDAWSFPVKEGE